MTLTEFLLDRIAEDEAIARTKRRVVERCSYILEDEDGEALETLEILALPYADHPGYREEWKP